MTVASQHAMLQKIIKVRDSADLKDKRFIGLSTGVPISILRKAGDVIGDPRPDVWEHGTHRYSHKFHRWFKRNAKQIKFLWEAGLL